MSITIEVYERTGPASSPVDRLINNTNWKSQSLPDNLHKYYYYPIRIPANVNDLHGRSAPTYIYAKISGTYKEIRRLRCVIVGNPELGHLNIGQTRTYVTPTNEPISDMSLYGQSMILIPSISYTSPQTAYDSPRTIGPNKTFYTNFIVSQFSVNGHETTVGNTDPVEFLFTMDEYE